MTISEENGELWYHSPSGYRQRLSTHQAKNDTRMFVNGKYIPKSNPLHKPGRYKTLDDAFSHAEIDKVKEGYVYVMINPAWPGYVKIGCAVSVPDRESSYQTGDPFRAYTMIGKVYSPEREKLETLCFAHCERSAEERRGEWFKINEVHALNIIRKEARNAAEPVVFNGPGVERST